VRKGNPKDELENCPVTLDEEYTTLHQEHAYLETEGVFAVPWPGRKGITVYANCQSPFLNRGNLVKTLGLSEDAVRVIQPPVGVPLAARMTPCISSRVRLPNWL